MTRVALALSLSLSQMVDVNGIVKRRKHSMMSTDQQYDMG